MDFIEAKEEHLGSSCELERILDSLRTAVCSVAEGSRSSHPSPIAYGFHTQLYPESETLVLSVVSSFPHPPTHLPYHPVFNGSDAFLQSFDSAGQLLGGRDFTFHSHP